MSNQFCKLCKENGVNTRVEWRPNPNKPGKNKPFDVDKQEWHKCPFYVSPTTTTSNNETAKQILNQYQRAFPDGKRPEQGTPEWGEFPYPKIL